MHEHMSQRQESCSNAGTTSNGQHAANKPATPTNDHGAHMRVCKIREGMGAHGCSLSFGELEQPAYAGCPESLADCGELCAIQLGLFLLGRDSELCGYGANRRFRVVLHYLVQDGNGDNPPHLPEGLRSYLPIRIMEEWHNLWLTVHLKQGVQPQISHEASRATTWGGCPTSIGCASVARQWQMAASMPAVPAVMVQSAWIGR